MGGCGHHRAVTLGRRRRRSRRRLLRAHRRVLRLPAQLRNPRTKAKMAAANGVWRNRLRDSDDRTGHWERPAGIRTRAVREGEDFVISGQKTFISNGQMCDLVIVVVRTAPEGGSRGMSLVLVEADRPGFRHGRNLEKLGHLSSDTSELFFDQIRVPVNNLLGAEGGAMGALMSELPQERLTIALHSIAAAQKAFDLAKDYVQQRNAFGSPIGNFQNTRFKLADLKSDLAVGWAYADQCLHDHINHELTTYAASTAKLWITEMHGRLVDQCLQFFGGYGFMREYEICRLYADARVLRIYGGTSEIMRELISRSL